MTRITFRWDLCGAWLDRIDARRLDLEAYRRLGVFVLRGAIPTPVVSEWIDWWRAFDTEALSSGRRINVYNPVVLNEALPEHLERLYRHPALLDVMEIVYPDLGFYLQRFVIKDRHNREPVFPHQDFSYNLGWPEKTSVFVPLSSMTPENGGVTLYPGTHQLGYLGDAGELDPAVLSADWPRVRPICEPGDLVLMHDCTWHESGPRLSEQERILVQITYQPSSDPSSTECLRGIQQPRLDFVGIPRERFFRRSRSSRLRELQRAVDEADRRGGAESEANSPRR